MRLLDTMTLLSLRLGDPDSNEERLGQILRRLGFVRTHHLVQALVLQKLEQKPLGESLIKLRYITEAQLEEALRVQRAEHVGPG